MAEIGAISVEQFEQQIGDEAYVVHIAGKGNMPRSADDIDLTAYTTYVQNYGEDSANPYDSFGQQMMVFKELDANVRADFGDIVALLREKALVAANDKIRDYNEIKQQARPEPGMPSTRFVPHPLVSRLVFTFDGDNYQDNSPFTKGIRMLIELGYAVYGVKRTPPKSTNHVDSWTSTANAPYTALIILAETEAWKDKEPKDFTRSRCDAYVSYGYPMLSRIFQPQKDEEILPDGKDKRGRRPPPSQKTTNGLVQSSMSSELNTGFLLKFSSMTDSAKTPRYLVLWQRDAKI
jgi:hypothetical protein